MITPRLAVALVAAALLPLPSPAADVEVLGPRILVVADVSGSMTTATGAGANACGEPQTRLGDLKCALSRFADSHGEVELALARFKQTPTSASCPCAEAALSCAGCDPATGAGCPAGGASADQGEILVPFASGNMADLDAWLDASCGTCTKLAAADPELVAVGDSPIAASLAAARRYLEGSDPSFPGSPIAADPLVACRPYRVLLIVDGTETCAASSDAFAAIDALRATNAAGTVVDVGTWVIALGASSSAELEEYALRGGQAGGVLAVGDDASLGAALAGLARQTTSVEVCNGADDDCDGLVDEGFGLGTPCDGADADACVEGTVVCDGAGGTTCGDVTDDRVEACNGLDDDCDGLVDEPPGDCGGCTPVPERCDGVDNDCDGRIDEEVVRPCSFGVGACTAGLQACDERGTPATAGTWGACSGTTPTAETCNGADDDCDGTTDGIVAACGNAAVGRCQPGAQLCLAGAWGACQREIGPAPERCNGADDDCDGTPDDGLVCAAAGGPIAMSGAVPGPAQAGEASGAGAGCGSSGAGAELVPALALLVLVVTRRRRRAGVAAISVALALQLAACGGGGGGDGGRCVPSAETCNGRDDDCDGTPDDGFDLATDPENCGSCGQRCTFASAEGRCAGGACEIDHCLLGFWDVDGAASTGCEYACAERGLEVCNGEDDDCDGQVDEGLSPPAICRSQGACAGTVATCDGVSGWRCHYPPTVSVDAQGDVVPETRCDGIDDDCDGAVDDAFPAKGQACVAGQGRCAVTGTQICAVTLDRTVCSATANPAAATAETCNGIDDDCDGAVDEGAMDPWVAISGGGLAGTRWIYPYEASRPDATASSQGTLATRACSAPGRLPWTRVTFDEATAACAAAGGRLCSELELRRACNTAAALPCTWSFATSCRTYAPSTCNGNDRDTDPGTAGDQDGLLPTGSSAGCYADWGGGNRIYDLSGNAKEWTLTQVAASTRRVSGGSSYDAPGAIACGDATVSEPDDWKRENVGFRCCRDTPPP